MPDFIPYQLIRGERKNIRLVVKHDASVVVRAPNHVSQKQIDDFLIKHQEWILKTREERKQKKALSPPLTDDEWEVLIQKAKEYIPARVSYFSEMMGVTPTAIKFSRALTRFGSCSVKNSISFSAILMRYPTPAIDYVIVHELAHITHKHHGPEFWERVATFLPDYKDRIKMLRE